MRVDLSDACRGDTMVEVEDSATADIDGVPPLVPARMVNEYAYCPRLFHLEWVQSLWAENADTAEGRWHHRAADERSGAAPLPDEGDLRVARSLQFSSPRLGLVAKVDVLEGDTGGSVVPVEVKRGRPPDIPERAWEPERVQVCVQGMLLREAGYRCDHGILYFAETRERVRVDLDDALISRTMELLRDLRRTAADETAPPPLVDSPKCPRCSLVGICLPDETNLLAARQGRRPRRLVPRDPHPRPLYVSTQGAYVSKRGGRLEVRADGAVTASTRLIDVSQVCLVGNVQVSSQLMRELFAREVPVLWYSFGGWFSGIAHGLPGKNVDLRRRQMLVDAPAALAIATRMVEGKIRNSRTLLRRNSRGTPERAVEQLGVLAEKARTVESAASLLGIEGAAARIYFDQFPTMLRPELRLPGAPFEFQGRNRRPPRDPVNCLLSFAYALLTKDLTVGLHAVGFDPYAGFYHRPRFGRPALALDVAEEFRPLIAESVVLNAINNGEVGSSSFVVRAGGVALTREGRRAVIAAYERRLEQQVRHPVFGYRISYRRVLDVQIRLLGAYLLGEVPEYVPFMTR